MSRVSVIGAGSWGCAFASLLAQNGVDTCLFVRKNEVLESLKRQRIHPHYLPGVKLSESIVFTGSIAEAMERADVVVMAVPVKYMRTVLHGLLNFVQNRHVFLSLSKGIENETFLRPTGIITDVLGVDESRTAALSGPNFALEVAKGLPTATVIASTNQRLAKALQRLVSCSNFRAYTSDDVIGVEVAGAMKNVIAIASGISDGLGLGYNAKASLITRGLAEISRLGLMFGARRDTFMGLAGIGDLVLTCTGDLSRNRRVGLVIAKEGRPEDFLGPSGMVAEGINTVRSAYEISLKKGIEMPITTEVYRIIYQKKDPQQAVFELMSRPLKSENL